MYSTSQRDLTQPDLQSSSYLIAAAAADLATGGFLSRSFGPHRLLPSRHSSRSYWPILPALVVCGEHDKKLIHVLRSL